MRTVGRKRFADMHEYELFSFFWCGKITPEVYTNISNTPRILSTQNNYFLEINLRS